MPRPICPIDRMAIVALGVAIVRGCSEGYGFEVCWEGCYIAWNTCMLYPASYGVGDCEWWGANGICGGFNDV